ncbi:MAG: O-antigen ligase family protein [Clostridia bacterium]|nr:O-antigen ligase family protein [Clostridia bacterium]
MASAQRGGGENGGSKNFFVRLVQTSIILTALDRFCAYIYHLIKTGFFGYIFSSYRGDLRAPLFARLRSLKTVRHFAEFRYGICRRLESSVIINGVTYFGKYLLGCRLRVYGVFFASFGFYTAFSLYLYSMISGNIASITEHPYILPALVMIFASVPLVFSRRTLSQSLCETVFGHVLMLATGFTEEELTDTRGSGGHQGIPFMLGIICGAMTYFVSPVYILLGLALCLWLYLVMIRPELGVLTLFFAMPILPTMLLGAVTAYTVLCSFIKIFRGKRILKIEPIDITVAAFAVLLFFGGTVSLSEQSLKPALLMVCFIFGYFVTVSLITTRAWLVRCSTACILSATLVSLYGIFIYFTGGGYSSSAWVDSEMFSTIGRRAVGTLENPNMFGEYLILIIPIAVGMLIGRGEGLRRIPAFFCIGIMGVCLILTWSRGAWLGLIFAALLFLFMWHRRSVWVILAGIASIPILPMVLPASIVSRFTSIGNMTDSSTSYRVYIWRATVNMIEDNLTTGIGIGEGAWDRLYPMYSYLGVEAAPHSHNLYLQIWLELGLAGLLVFVVFLFLLYQSGLTLFSRLAGDSELSTPDLSGSLLRQNLSEGTDITREMKRSKTQLRLSAAAPLCGIFAVLVQGMTDYAWYNYRLYLMFWLICGLASAYIRNGSGQIRTTYINTSEHSSADFPLDNGKKKIRKKPDADSGLTGEHEERKES